MLIGHCARTRKGEGFIAHQRAHCENARGRVRRPVIDAGSRKADRIRVNGARGVACVGDIVVAACVSVGQRHAAHRHGLVAGPGIFVVEGERPAGEAVSGKNGPRSSARRACRRRVAVVDLGDIGGGKSEIRLVDVGGGRRLIDQRIVVFIGSDVSCGQRHRFGVADVLVREGAGDGVDRQIVAFDLAGQSGAGRADRGVCCSVIGPVARRDPAGNDGLRCNRAGGVARVSDIVVAACVSIVDRHAADRHGFVAGPDIFVVEGERPSGKAVSGKNGSRRGGRRACRRRVAVVDLGDIGGGNRQIGPGDRGLMRAAGQGVVGRQAGVIAQRQGTDSDGKTGSDVPACNRSGAGQGQGLAVHQGVHGEFARGHIGRAVIAPAAGQADHVRVYDQVTYLGLLGAEIGAGLREIRYSDVVVADVGKVAGRAGQLEAAGCPQTVVVVVAVGPCRCQGQCFEFVSCRDILGFGCRKGGHRAAVNLAVAGNPNEQCFCGVNIEGSVHEVERIVAFRRIGAGRDDVSAFALACGSGNTDAVQDGTRLAIDKTLVFGSQGRIDVGDDLAIIVGRHGEVLLVHSQRRTGPGFIAVSVFARIPARVGGGVGLVRFREFGERQVAAHRPERCSGAVLRLRIAVFIAAGDLLGKGEGIAVGDGFRLRADREGHFFPVDGVFACCRSFGVAGRGFIARVTEMAGAVSNQSVSSAG